MGAVRTHKTKNERNAPIKFPSFVYRQDGHELSYELMNILPEIATVVKPLGWLTLAVETWYNQEELGFDSTF
jgi:hypothetical protein